LLELTIDGAKGVLFNITSGPSLGMFEIDEAAKVITKNVDPDAKVKFGAVIDEDMGDEVRITVIATGFDESNRRPAPVVLPAVDEHKKPTSVHAPVQDQTPVREPVARKPLFTPASVDPVPTMQPAAEDEDELDVPAFIRKKMK